MTKSLDLEAKSAILILPRDFVYAMAGQAERMRLVRCFESRLINKGESKMQNVYKTKAKAIDALNSQPFTLACRARHEVVPVYQRNLLGEIVSAKPIGYGYRLKSK